MSAVANSEDQEICFACGEPLLPGQLVLQDVEEGLMHRACCGPEREAFCNLATGEPLGPDEPLPEGFPYAPATTKAPDAETRLRELEAELVETKEAAFLVVRETNSLLKRALTRIDDLLAANTVEVERRREAERKVREALDAKEFCPLAGSVLRELSTSMPDGEWRISDVVDSVSGSRKELYNAIGYLRRKGKILRVGHGRYRRADLPAARKPAPAEAVG